jgi:hypothetical protein
LINFKSIIPTINRGQLVENEFGFIFVKSVTTDVRRSKVPLWTKRAFVRSYTPTYDEDKEWVSRDMREQIASTVSSLEKANLKDKDKVYVVIGVQSQFVEGKDPTKIRKFVFYKDTLTLIKNLSAEILCSTNGCKRPLLKEIVTCGNLCSSNCPVLHMNDLVIPASH